MKRRYKKIALILSEIEIIKKERSLGFKFLRILYNRGNPDPAAAAQGLNAVFLFLVNQFPDHFREICNTTASNWMP